MKITCQNKIITKILSVDKCKLIQPLKGLNTDHGRLIGSRVCSIEWCHVQSPWVTPNPDFEGAPLLPAIREYGRISFAVFLCVRGYRYLGDGGTNRREIVHDGTYISRMSFWRHCPQGFPNQILGLNFSRLTANISKTVSRSVTCQLYWKTAHSPSKVV